MSLDRVLPLDIQWIYLISDLVVLLISLTYIPVSKIILFAFDRYFIRTDYWGYAKDSI